MRRFTAIGLGLVLSVMLVAVTAAAPPPKFFHLLRIGIQNIHLDDTFVSGGGLDEMKALVETGSLDPRCLATLSEANFVGGVGITMLFCNPRQIERDGRLMNGLAVRIFFTGAVQPGATVDVNYYQERMRTNPAPIPCGEC